MPSRKDRFEEIGIDGDDPALETNAARILEFLRAHPDEAFTQSEIADETGVPAGSVGPTLVRLRACERVDPRETYWRSSDHDRSVDAATEHAAAAIGTRARSMDETPVYDEGQAHAVDPRQPRESGDAFASGDVFWAPDPFAGKYDFCRGVG